MYNEYDKIITFKQLDSLCRYDTLNVNYKTWYNMPFYDDDSGEKITEYVFIKKNNEYKETTYILRTINNSDSLFNMTKRITIKENSK